MNNKNEIVETIKMIQEQNLDVRTITMGISLIDCMDTDIKKSCQKVYDKIYKYAKDLVKTGEAISKKYGKKIHGWWIDCCYEPGICGGRGTRYDYKRYANALRAGNEDSIVAFNFRGTCAWK